MEILKRIHEEAIRRGLIPSTARPLAEKQWPRATATQEEARHDDNARAGAGGEAEDD